jgi:hypothetical protein
MMQERAVLTCALLCACAVCRVLCTDEQRAEQSFASICTNDTWSIEVIYPVNAADNNTNTLGLMIAASRLH